MAQFGNWATSTNYEDISGNCYGSLYRASSSGIADSVTVSYNNRGVVHSIRCAIYSSDGNFIAQTNQRNFTTENGINWYELSFSKTGAASTFNIEADTEYYIVCWGGYNTDCRLEFAGTIHYYGRRMSVPFTGDFEHDMPTINTQIGLRDYSLYCTYTEPEESEKPFYITNRDGTNPSHLMFCGGNKPMVFSTE